MDLLPFQFTPISNNLFVYRGAVNTGVLLWGDRALLIDCDDTLTSARLAELGIRGVERIYCTQHRRPNTAGISAFDTVVYAPLGERSQFEDASVYWQDWRNRWHLYHFRPGPLAPLQDIAIAGTVSEGDCFQWGRFSIRVLDTPGMTDGAVSYLVEGNTDEGSPYRAVFCGDVIYAPGQVWDVYSLQKSMGGYKDYHGFLGASKMLIASLGKLGSSEAACLIPSHGSLIIEPAAAAQLTAERLEKLYRNYAATSAINLYFPFIFQELSGDLDRMVPAPVMDFPNFIRPVAFTSFAIQSESGALWLIDCGHDSVIDTLFAWKDQGVYTEVEGCWVTHYHDDHVDSLHRLAVSIQAPIYADEHMAEILEHPNRFFLPCISPSPAPVNHVTTDGETWRWREFELTALHLPGQSLYHGGLLLRGRGVTVLFCGDSFAPNGLDDYTAGNRNFIGADKGYRRCIDLLRQHRPDYILNQHQQKAFTFSGADLDYLENMLVDREKILTELLPWDHPNFGIDEGWLRAYPYEVEAGAGGTCTIEVRATNHAAHPLALTAEPVLPVGWEWHHLPAADLLADDHGGEWIIREQIAFSIPPGTAAGTYPVAFRVNWGGRYLGQACHALLKVC